MTGRDIAIHVFAAVLMLTALWLLAQVGWRVALGVFLFAWGNNLIYSTRLKNTIQKGLWRK